MRIMGQLNSHDINCLRVCIVSIFAFLFAVKIQKEVDLTTNTL